MDQALLPAISPAVITTLGGLSVLLLLALLIKAVTGLVSAFKGKKNGNGNGSVLDLSKSPHFCVHASEQTQLFALVKESERREAEMKECLSKLVGFSERQANSLERLVELRREFIHSRGNDVHF